MALNIKDIQSTSINKVAKKSFTFNELLNKDISLFGSRFNDKRKEDFYSSLSILFSSGLDFRTSIELLEEEQTKEKDKILYRSIKDEIVSGKSFSEVLRSKEEFSEYEYYSVKIGEESGKLKNVLNELAIFYGRKIEQKRKLIGSLSYPFIVLLTAIGAIYFMLSFIVPMFEDVFARFGGDLPGVTKFVIALSEALSGSFLYILLGVALLLAFIFTQKKKHWFRASTSAVGMRLPLLGPLIRKNYLARMCFSLNLLTSANTPLLQSISLVKKMIGFYPIENALENIESEILKGRLLHQSMSAHDVFDKRMVTLVRVAEEINQLDLIFEKLANQYNKDVDHQSSVLGSAMEPIMIIFVGVLVAGILVAMYLPLFNMSTAIG